MNTSSTPATNATDPAIKNTTGDPWRILLIELINLFGLVLTHSRHARGARAAAVIIDQIIRRLHNLDRMPDHQGAIIVRRIGPTTSGKASKPDYHLTFGNQSFCLDNAMIRAGQINKTPHHLTGALEQAFGSFHEQGIESLFLQLPGSSSEKIDQLRLSLNILARFRQAAENNASITFRYIGRAMTIPLVRDSSGKPDPNLTLVAGLNGLTAVNMREIVKQAVSFCMLSSTEVADECSSDNYSKIFHVRGLRSQLIQPAVEINTIPWLKEDAHCERPESPPIGAAGGGQTLDSVPDRIGKEAADDRSHLSDVASATLFLADFGLSLNDLGPDMDARDQKGLESIFVFDSDALNAETLAEHLVLVNRSVHTMAHNASSLAQTQKFLDFLISRLEQLPEIVLTRMEMKRQGLTIEFQGRKLIVGMVHPRLVELITLVKDKQATRQKIAACRDCAHTIFQNPRNSPFTDLLGIYGTEADSVLTCLKECFDGHAGLNRSRFLGCLDHLRQHENAIFEMLWCVFRNMPQEKDHSAFHMALPLIVKELKDVTSAIGFLLADLFQKPYQVVASDRNAFVLATFMLRTHRNEHDVDINKTPDEVLAIRKSLDSRLLQQAAWRLEIDRTGILFKFKMMRDLLYARATDMPSNGKTDGLAFEPLLAMQREGLIFMALTGGQTALAVFREALAYYSDPIAAIYQEHSRHAHMHGLMAHLEIVLRGMVILGTPDDLNALKMVEQSAPRLMALDADPSYARRVKQALQWIAPAIRSIQVQLQ